MKASPKKVYFGPLEYSTGGPLTFKKNLLSASRSILSDIEITWDPDDADLYLIIAESVSLKIVCKYLWRRKKIVFRLDGRRKIEDIFFDFRSDTHMSFRNLIFDIYRQLLRNIKCIFSFLVADLLIYQSEFVKREWSLLHNIKSFFFRSVFSHVIINGAVRQDKNRRRNKVELGVPDERTLIFAKGTILRSDFFFMFLNFWLTYKNSVFWKNRKVLIDIFGDASRLSSEIKLVDCAKSPYDNVVINFRGVVDSEAVQRAMIEHRCVGYLVFEDFPACPNSVIEAQCSGLPVIGPVTGSMKELALIPKYLIDLSVGQKEFDARMLEALRACFDRTEKESEALADAAWEAFGDNSFLNYEARIIELFEL